MNYVTFPLPLSQLADGNSLVAGKSKFFIMLCLQARHDRGGFFRSWEGTGSSSLICFFLFSRGYYTKGLREKKDTIAGAVCLETVG